ncbi:MAG: hypothetical protein ABIM96_00435 [Candidatus Saccharimonas sp.]
MNESRKYLFIITTSASSGTGTNEYGFNLGVYTTPDVIMPDAIVEEVLHATKLQDSTLVASLVRALDPIEEPHRVIVEGTMMQCGWVEDVKLKRIDRNVELNEDYSLLDAFLDLFSERDPDWVPVGYGFNPVIL